MMSNYNIEIKVMIAMLYKLGLKDLSKKLGRICYIELESELVKRLFSLFNRKNKSKELANFLGIKFNEKWNTCPTLNNWYSRCVIPLWAIEKLLTISTLTWGDIEKNFIGISLHGGRTRIQIKPKFPIKLNKELGCIIGHILGDGSINKKYSQVFYTNKNKELLNEFSSCMKTIFGINPRIWIQELSDFKTKKSKWVKRVDLVEEIPDGMQGGLFYPSICGVFLYAIFGKFAYGNYKKIPAITFNSSKEFKKALIRAFCDDESSVINSHDIRIFQDNKKILENIKELLFEFGIETSRIKDYLKRNKKRYFLSINGYFNFLKFRNEIGFTSSIKLNKLDRLIEKLSNSPSLRLRRGETKNIILESLKNRKLTYNRIREILKSKYPIMKWSEHSIRFHLTDLEKENKISKEIKGKTYFWSKKCVL